MSISNQDTILVVDDDSVNLAIIEDTLKNMGLVVITAQEGTTALSKAKREKPALILLDIMMPEISGYEVCQRLKGDEATRDIPVIFMTALSYNTDKTRAFEVGASDYVIKPVQSDELLARVTVHLTVIRQKKEIEILRSRLK